MKMKKRLFTALAMTCIVALAGCSSSSNSGQNAQNNDSNEEVADDNVLTVAMECGYAPYNWTQPDDSNGAVQIKDSPDYAYGYDVIMAKHIAEKLGMELEIVKLDWDSLVPAVQSGTVDCVIAGQSITSERLEMVDFTEPYYYASIVPSSTQYLNSFSIFSISFIGFSRSTLTLLAPSNPIETVLFPYLSSILSIYFSLSTMPPYRSIQAPF
ncbi:putative histidine-binding protein [Clostridiales bacterium]|nr:putative histidine-binding protein [Clostridiales bacterium]